MWSGGNRIMRVVLRAVRGGDQQVNTLHYRFNDSDPDSVNSPQSLADAVAAAVLGPMAALYRPDWSIQPVEVLDEFDPLDTLGSRSGWVSGAAAAGTRGADSDYLPLACCLVASLQTNLIGRRHRGRLFVGGSWGETDQDTGNWTPTAIARAKAFTDAIPRTPDVAPGISTSDAHWVVYSRTARTQGVAAYAADIGSVVHRAPVHWLRSREP